MIGYLLSALSIGWCSFSASGIFVSVLQMSEQRLLVAYPVGLFCALALSDFADGSRQLIRAAHGCVPGCRKSDSTAVFPSLPATLSKVR